MRDPDDKTGYRIETDGIGEVPVPADKLWGAQTQRALGHFPTGGARMPVELIRAYGHVKKAAAETNHRLGRLDEAQRDAIVRVCDELIAGEHDAMFPLPVWISGSGTQFNMNVNEVIANRAAALAGLPLGGKKPVHPNDHANLSQSTNDTFPTAMHIAAALAVSTRLLPAVSELRDAFAAKARAWADIVKIGRTHLQDATPLTLGQEFSGYESMLTDACLRLEQALPAVRRLALGGTAVGTGINAPVGFDRDAIALIAAQTGEPFLPASNKFAAQGAHDALVHLSSTLRGLAVSLKKIADDIRFLGCGPRAGIGELRLPENEPGSSIMPGKVNPTQCESLGMIALQVLANDVAVGLGGAGGHLEMNAYKPLVIANLLGSIGLLSEGCALFREHLVEGLEPDVANIAGHVGRSLMLVTALTPAIGYDAAARVAHHASDHGVTLREAALALAVISEAEFDRLVDPRRMLGPR